MPSPHALPFDLSSLLVLLQVAEQGSVQAAAKRLGTSRATVRRRIEELEAAVGEQLVHRGTRGARLTRAGDVLVERGRALIEGVHDALSDTRHAATEASGVVRVVVPVGMQPRLQVEVLSSVQAAGIGIRLELDQHADPRGLVDGDYDLMFHFGPPPANPVLFSRVLRRAPLVLVASQTYLDAHGTPEGPEDLTKHTLLVWKGLGHPTDQLPLCTGGAIRVQPWLASPDIYLLRRLAEAGVGIAFCPEGNIPVEADMKPLVQVLSGVVGRDEVFRATSPLSTRLDPRAAEFVERARVLLHALPEI